MLPCSCSNSLIWRRCRRRLRTDVMRTGLVDFEKLNASRLQVAPTDPLRVFQRLPKPQHINDLWESQSDALRIWAKRRSENDLVIKLNTGGGKTLVGLLIAQALVNEMRRPVLYLCANNQLVRQTIERRAKCTSTVSVIKQVPETCLPSSSTLHRF